MAELHILQAYDKLRGMKYFAVTVCDHQGKEIGFGVAQRDKVGPIRMQSVHLFDEIYRAQEVAKAYAEQEGLREFWPSPIDSEVVAIIRDKEFLPHLREVEDGARAHEAQKVVAKRRFQKDRP